MSQVILLQKYGNGNNKKAKQIVDTHHIMAKPPRNMAWLGHANLPKTNQTNENVIEYGKSKPTTTTRIN